MRRKNNKIPKLHVRKDDTVLVLSGNADVRGSRGRVLEVYPRKQKALVEGVNIIVRHIRPNQDYPNGGRVEKEAPIHVSKLMVIDPKSGQPTRIGREKTDRGWKRIAKRTGNRID